MTTYTLHSDSTSSTVEGSIADAALAALRMAHRLSLDVRVLEADIKIVEGSVYGHEVQADHDRVDESTTYTFVDGSRLRVSGREAEVL